MARKTKIEIEFEAVTSEFSNGIKQMNGDIKSLNKELKLNATQLKEDANNVDLLKERQRLLKEELAKSTEKVELTNQKLEEAKKYFGEDSDKVRQLKNELTDAKNQQQAISNAINETNQKIIVQTEKSLTLGKSMQEIGGKIENAGSKIENLGNKLSIVSGATATIGGISIKTAASFDSYMRKVAATMGITAKEIEQGSEDFKILESAAQKCGETTKYSASEAAEGLNYLALAGYDAKKSAEVLPKVLNLAAAGDLELATASDMVTDAMAALNMETKDLDKYINEMAKTSQKSNTNVAQLGEATLTVAGTAKLANMSLETMNAELGILANNGIKGAEGGTHLRNIILSLTSPTDVAADALKKLGINVADSKGNVRDLNDIMSDFNKKLEGMSDEKKTNIISSIFNKTDISAVNALIKGSGAEFTNLKNEITNCGNAAQDIADVMNSSFEGELTLLKSQLESNAIAIGKKLMPTAKGAVKVISDLSTKFSKLTDEQVKSIVKTGAFVVALGPAVKIGGKLISTTGSVVKSIGTFTQAIGVAKTGTSSGIQSVNSLAKVLTGLASPVGISVAALGTLTAVLIKLKAAEFEERTSLKGLKDEVENQKKSWEDLQEARKNNLNGSMTEIEKCKELKEELFQITDENGKEKEGYEDRAEFILGTLNGALGTEYKLNGNVIESYKKLQSEIDTTIEKKKAEAVLTAYNEEFAVAQREQVKATQTLISLKEQQLEASRKLATGNYEERLEAQQTLSVIGNKMKEQTDLIGSYGKTIQDYENLQKASAEGSKEAITKAIDEIGISYDTVKAKAGESTIEQINAQQKYVDAIKNSLEEAKKTKDTYQQKILENQLKSNQDQLTTLENSLKTQTNTVKELTPEQIEAWKDIANRSSIEYEKLLKQVPEETRKKIVEATGVVATDVTLSKQFGEEATNATALFKDELKINDATQNKIQETSTTIQNDTSVNSASSQLAKSAEYGFNNNVNGVALGNNLSSNIASGITSSSSRSLIGNAVSKFTGWISSSLSAISNMRVAPAIALPGHADGLNYVPYDNYVARLHKGERVLTAKENEEYNKAFGAQGILSAGVNRSIMNNHTTNNRNIVVQFYPQQMTNSEMEKAFNYIDKRYGQYMP